MFETLSSFSFSKPLEPCRRPFLLACLWTLSQSASSSVQGMESRRNLSTISGVYVSKSPIHQVVLVPKQFSFQSGEALEEANGEGSRENLCRTSCRANFSLVGICSLLLGRCTSVSSLIRRLGVCLSRPFSFPGRRRLL